MATGVTSLLARSTPTSPCHDYQAKLLNVDGLSRCSMLCGASASWRRELAVCSSSRFDPLRGGGMMRGKGVAVAAASESSNESPEGGKARQKTRARQDVATLRERVSEYIDKKSAYFWLGGPVVVTAAVFLPPALVPLAQLLQRNYLAGLVAAFGLDALFVLAADLFFVLADKAGHHQTIAGGSPPWIGPWEYTGHPKGEPLLTKLVAYTGVAVGVLGAVLSLFVGKLAVGLPAFGPYLALIFVQVAYERLLLNDRVPAYPLVPLVYTMYRFKQLAKAAELVAVMGGGAPLAFIVKLLTIVWTFYLGIQLTQIPWLYSTWNSNKAT